MYLVFFPVETIVKVPKILLVAGEAILIVSVLSFIYGCDWKWGIRYTIQMAI